MVNAMIESKRFEAVLSDTKRQLLEKLLSSTSNQRSTEMIPRVRPGVPVALSSAQARIWFLSRTYTESAEYNVLGPPLRLTIDTSQERVEAALRALMGRHDALRLRFLELEGEPMQQDCPDLEPPLAWHDLSGSPASEVKRQADEIGNRAARTPFRLDQAPLFRVSAIRLADGQLILSLIAHHIIVDGWSLDILYDELHALLVEGPLNPPTGVRYLDYVSWERAKVNQQRLSQQLDYWRRKLAGRLPLLDVPKDRPWTSIRNRRGHAVSCSLPSSVTQLAKALAAAEGTTLFVTLLAAYKALLLRLTGQCDLIVGIPLAGRDHPIAEELVGSFARIVALRTNLEGNPSFREVVRRVHATTLEAQDNQLVPFERIVADLRIPRELNCSPVFQTVFGLHTASGILGDPATRADLAYDSETSKWDLSLSLIDSGQEVFGFLEYSSDLYDEATAARYADAFARLLSAMVAEPDRDIKRHPLISAEEKTRILSELNTLVRLKIPYSTLAEPFEDQVRRTPEAIALVGDEGALTYRELNEKADRLAHLLREQGVAPGGWVAVCMERGFDLLTALYAIAKTGAAYVPLDPQLPSGRLLFQLEDTETSLVLTHTAAMTSVPDGPWRTINVDEVPAAPVARAVAQRHGDTSDAHLGYLMYTSGTTGRPKAVAFPVNAALSSIFWLQRCFPVKEGDRHILKTPYSFDVSIWELFWPLYFGGALVVCRPDGHLDQKYLAGLIEQHQVTSICFVPSMMQAFLDEIAPGSCRSLRWVHCGGEPLTPRLRDAYHSRLGATLINGYGPTETHAVTLMEIPPNEGHPRVPLGRPIAAYRLYVLDEDLCPQPIGVPGELYIGGEVGLAHGYHRRPALTAERFSPDPFGPAGARMYRTGDMCRYDADGVLEHLGRCDTQVKLLGMRIELAEIESVLGEHEAVRNAIVLPVTGEGVERLVSFVVPHDDRRFDAQDVIKHAARFLPRHMLPASIVCIDAIPTTHNGKVDQEGLLARWREAEIFEFSDVVGPVNESERRLKQIFQQVLGLESVSMTAGFFDLGGHSLLIFKLLAACERELNFRLTPADVFAAPSVRELAARIDSATKATRTNLVPLSPQYGKPIIVFIHGGGGSALPFIEVAKYLSSDFSIFGLQTPGLDDDTHPIASIEDLAAGYVETVDPIRGLSPLILAGWSMGGCVGLEMARQWQRRGVVVAALLMIDSWITPGDLASADALEEWRRALLDLDLFGQEGSDERKGLERSAGSDTVAGLGRVMDANRRALLDYEPIWYDGEVDFLRAAEPLPDEGRRFPEICLSRDRGWGHHVRSMTVHPIAGDHFTLIAKENAASLADTIRQIVDTRLSFSEV
jgi:amino acid adenylation domain-containing protein